MNDRILKCLYDMCQAIDYVESFLRGKSFDDYLVDALLRSAVERQVEILCESLNRIYKLDPAVATRITNYKKIIAFRNLLISAYDNINNGQVWSLIHQNFYTLREEVEKLKQDSESEVS